jgi:hypothetical protein
MISNFRNRTHGGARTLDAVSLLNGYGWGNATNMFNLGPVQPIQELAGVWREGFNVASLALGIKGVQCQTRLAGAAHTRYGNQLVSGEVQTQTFQIILPRTEYPDALIISHFSFPIRHWHRVQLPLAIMQDPSNPLKQTDHAPHFLPDTVGCSPAANLDE